eukprot:TRINITY_DN7101_c0_g4_i1.p1 TRINITY_DN7101_c0_g4~~TRINITY_DN7101_c0_g4_i1.p1  ORF type:complete len:161 (-),score=39.29 TRINITY_DN7101_c0_g4_i1:31-513(-)
MRPLRIHLTWQVFRRVSDFFFPDASGDVNENDNVEVDRVEKKKKRDEAVVIWRHFRIPKVEMDVQYTGSWKLNLDPIEYTELELSATDLYLKMYRDIRKRIVTLETLRSYRKRDRGMSVMNDENSNSEASDGEGSGGKKGLRARILSRNGKKGSRMDEEQ